MNAINYSSFVISWLVFELNSQLKMPKINPNQMHLLTKERSRQKRKRGENQKTHNRKVADIEQ